MMRHVFFISLSVPLLFSCSTKVIYVEDLERKEIADTVKEQEKSIYQKDIEEKIKGLVSEPITPIRTPELIGRILFLPYVSKNGELVSNHYVYFKIDDGRWILGDYIVDNPIEKKKLGREVANPLGEPVKMGQKKQEKIEKLDKEGKNQQGVLQKSLQDLGLNPKEEKGLYEDKD